jgi:hypothetical protein
MYKIYCAFLQILTQMYRGAFSTQDGNRSAKQSRLSIPGGIGGEADEAEDVEVESDGEWVGYSVTMVARFRGKQLTLLE